jgi:Methyltransferase TRM13
MAAVLERFSPAESRAFSERLRKAVEILERQENPTNSSSAQGDIPSLSPFPVHPSFSAVSSGLGPAKLRHCRQESQLLELMRKEGFLDLVDTTAKESTTSLVELGCGTASLSLHLARARPQDRKKGGDSSEGVLRHVLLDRKKFRSVHTCDSRIRNVLRECGTAEEGSVRRFTVDICNWETSGLLECLLGEGGTSPPSTPAASTVILYSKHFCGVATDLALKMAADLRGKGFRVGLIIACCCHALCEKDGGEFSLLEQIGLGTDFEMLRAFSGWATLSHEEAPEEGETGPDHQRSLEPGLERRDERRVLGELCKRVVDECRVRTLRSWGWESARRVTYTDQSPECHCILAPPCRIVQNES